MKLNYRLIVLVLIAILSVLFLTYPVVAETGSITVVDAVTKSYYTGTASAGPLNFSKIAVYSAGYNAISEYYITEITDGYLRLVSNGTFFTIIGGGSGGGYVSYNKYGSIISWEFYNTTITDSVLTLVYEVNIFDNNNLVLIDMAGGSAPDIDRPACVVVSTGTCWGTHGSSPWKPVLHNTVIATSSSILYNITYPIQGKYVVNIIKPGIVLNKVTFMNSTARQWFEETFNSIGFNSPLLDYTTGLYINLSIPPKEKIVLINSTDVIDVSPKEIVVDPITGVGIMVTPTTGYLGTVFNISWLRTKPTPFGYIDSIEIFESGITAPVNFLVSPPDSGYTKATFTVASYTVKFQRKLYLIGTPETLASASFEVKPEQPSYILVNATVPTNYPVNIKYLLGYTPAMQIITNGLEVRQVATGWLTYTCYNDNIIGEQEYNCNVTFPADGQYKITLKEFVKGDVVVKYVTAKQMHKPPTFNVTTSSLSLDKSSYYRTDLMKISYEIDDTNYSNFMTYYAFYNTTTGKNIANHKLDGSQIGIAENVLGSYLDSFDYTRFLSGSGDYNVSLRAKNNTIDFMLASVNFGYSDVNRRGIYLSLNKDTICIDETIYISYITPEQLNLTIQESYSGKIVKKYVVNTSGTLKLKMVKAGIYLVSLEAVSDKTIQALDDFKVSTCVGDEDGDGIPDDKDSDYIGYGGDTTATCGFWNNCVNGMFPGQGLNNVTRLLFALLCIVIVMFFGMVVSKGNFGVSVILGFIPYAFFTYLTLSSPCGEYMPVWVSIFIALIVGIKMKWFS